MNKGPCPICEGRGGDLERDMQGDGVWATPVTYYAPCECAENGFCPGCLVPGVPIDADINEFTCESCGWAIDWDRIERAHDPDY